MNKSLLFITILFWATFWASHCSSKPAESEVGAIGPDPLIQEIHQITREHAQGRAAFDSLRQEIAQTRRTTDSVKFVVRELIEQKKFEAQMEALAKYPIRTDTPPCKPVPCYTTRPDTVRLYVPKDKNKQ